MHSRQDSVSSGSQMTYESYHKNHRTMTLIIADGCVDIVHSVRLSGFHGTAVLVSCSTVERQPSRTVKLQTNSAAGTCIPSDFTSITIHHRPRGSVWNCVVIIEQPRSRRNSRKDTINPRTTGIQKNQETDVTEPSR